MKFFQSATCEVIPRNQMAVMFLRGIIGLGLMAWSFNFMVSIPLLGFSMLGVAIILLKGCPACWGMHMVNVMRRSTKTEKNTTTLADDFKSRSLKPGYHPKDMASHLFPAEDVARFKRERQQQESVESDKKHMMAE